MKKILLPIAFVVALSALTLSAQIAPKAEPDPMKTLMEIKAVNLLLLEQQAKALAELEEMKDAARQVKIFSKRG